MVGVPVDPITTQVRVAVSKDFTWSPVELGGMGIKKNASRVHSIKKRFDGFEIRQSPQRYV